jgi:hypothetical protein
MGKTAMRGVKAVLDDERDRFDFPWTEVIRREIETWQPSRRLELDLEGRRAPVHPNWQLAALVVGTLALLLNFAVATRSVDPRQWWEAAQTVVRDLVQATPPGHLSGPSRVAVMGADPYQHVAGAASAGGSGSKASTVRSAADGQSGGSPTVGISVATGRGAGTNSSQGVEVTSNPRGRGGMTGAIGEGPLHASGTVDGAGMRGCMGAYSPSGQGSNICGAANSPATAPVPALPAPVLPDAAPAR